jgi:hypothetical protein
MGTGDLARKRMQAGTIVLVLTAAMAGCGGSAAPTPKPDGARDDAAGDGDASGDGGTEAASPTDSGAPDSSGSAGDAAGNLDGAAADVADGAIEAGGMDGQAEAAADASNAEVGDGGPQADGAVDGATDGGSADAAAAPRCDVAPHVCPGSLSCVAGYCIDCAATTCPVAGEQVIVADYLQAPQQAAPIALGTTLAAVDVALAIDSTASMTAALANLKAGVGTFTAAPVPSPAYAVVDFKDFGSSHVISADGRIQTIATAAGLGALQSALAGLTAEGGGDAPEAGWEALYAIAGGPPIAISGYSSAIDLSTTPPAPPTPGESQGDLGGIGFRRNALPLVVTISDAEWHDAPGVASAGENGLNDYGSAQNGAPSRAATVSALRALGVRVIGLAGLGGTAGNPKARALALATDTTALVAPADFGTAASRPAGCSTSQCCTGVAAAGEAPDSSGRCPLAFTYPSTATGLSPTLSLAVQTMVSGARFGLYPVAADVDSGAVATFVKAVNLVTDGTDGLGCLVAATGSLIDQFSGPTATSGPDGTADTVPNQTTGTPLCVRITPNANTTIQRKNVAQFFRVSLQVRTSGTPNLALGSRGEVTFMVPPS